MKQFLYTGIVHISLLCSLASAQNRTEIFADTKDNDTLQKLVTIFMDQLKKSFAG